MTDNWEHGVIPGDHYRWGPHGKASDPQSVQNLHQLSATNAPSQTRIMSAIEAVANVVLGYGVAVGTQVAVFPLFGLSATLRQNMAMGLIFTAVSLVRSYALRRVFNKLSNKKIGWSK